MGGNKTVLSNVKPAPVEASYVVNTTGFLVAAWEFRKPEIEQLLGASWFIFDAPPGGNFKENSPSLVS
jgi:hypothetical protein